MKIYLTLSRINNNADKIKTVLKEADLSKNFYQIFLVKLKDLPEFMDVMNGKGTTAAVPDFKQINKIQGTDDECGDSDNLETGNQIPDYNQSSEVKPATHGNINSLKRQMEQNNISDSQIHQVIEEIESLLRIHQLSPIERNQVLSKQLHFESTKEFSKRKFTVENSLENISLNRNAAISRAKGHCELCQSKVYPSIDGSDLLSIHFLDNFNQCGARVERFN